MEKNARLRANYPAPYAPNPSAPTRGALAPLELAAEHVGVPEDMPYTPKLLAATFMGSFDKDPADRFPALLDGRDNTLVTERAIAAAVPEEFVTAWSARPWASCRFCKKVSPWVPPAFAKVSRCMGRAVSFNGCLRRTRPHPTLRKSPPGGGQEEKRRHPMHTYTGVPASTGIVVGPVEQIDHGTTGLHRIVCDPFRERALYDVAVVLAKDELRRLSQRAKGPDADILLFQIALLEDESFTNEIGDYIAAGAGGAAAVERAEQIFAGRLKRR